MPNFFLQMGGLVLSPSVAPGTRRRLGVLVGMPAQSRLSGSIIEIIPCTIVADSTIGDCGPDSWRFEWGITKTRGTFISKMQGRLTLRGKLENIQNNK